jgi:prophage maintenance system killer protein
LATTKPDVEPLWLPPEEVVRLNAEALGEAPDSGPALADLSGVERALNRPRVLYAYHNERDVMRLACAVLVGLIEERPFARHNLGTGLAALLLFLEANGYRWTGPDTSALAAYVRALAAGRYTEEGLAETLRPDLFPA